MDPEAKRRRLDNIRKVLGPLPGDPVPVLPAGRPSYVVRVGDSLPGIAGRHPLLADRQMWTLLASVNGLSTDTDKSGNPVIRLKRGTVLLLPSVEQIESFKKPAGASDSEQSGSPNPR